MRLAVASLALIALLVPLSPAGGTAGRTFVPGESLGGVRLGMTKAQVLHAWGKRHGVCRDCARMTWYFNDRPFAPEGAGVVFARGRVAHVFTVWRPPGWRTSDGLTLGAPAERIGSAYVVLEEVSCTGYTALVAAIAGARSVFYVYRGKLWGFGLMRPDSSPCL